MLALALLMFGLLQAPVTKPEQDDVRKTLERLETEWNVAHVCDAAALDRIFSDDVVIIVPGMRVMTKADAVGMFTSGRMKFDKYDTTETTFRTLDNTAIVTGRLKRTRVSERRDHLGRRRARTVVVHHEWWTSEQALARTHSIEN